MHLTTGRINHRCVFYDDDDDQLKHCGDNDDDDDDNKTKTTREPRTDPRSEFLTTES